MPCPPATRCRAGVWGCARIRGAAAGRRPYHESFRACQRARCVAPALDLHLEQGEHTHGNREKGSRNKSSTGKESPCRKESRTGEKSRRPSQNRCGEESPGEESRSRQESGTSKESRAGDEGSTSEESGGCQESRTSQNRHGGEEGSASKESGTGKESRRSQKGSPRQEGRTSQDCSGQKSTREGSGEKGAGGEEGSGGQKSARRQDHPQPSSRLAVSDHRKALIAAGAAARLTSIQPWPGAQHRAVFSCVHDDRTPVVSRQGAVSRFSPGLRKCAADQRGSSAVPGARFSAPPCDCPVGRSVSAASRAPVHTARRRARRRHSRWDRPAPAV